MPPVEEIERTRRILIRIAVITILVIIATSGTKYAELPIALILLPLWYAIIYSWGALKSFARYMQTNYPEYYKTQSFNAVRRSGYGANAVWLISPYSDSYSNRKVRPEIIEMLKDPGYISSLEHMQVFKRTFAMIAASEFAATILFGLLKLWR